MTLNDFDNGFYALLITLNNLDVIKFYEQREDLFMAYARKYNDVMRLPWL